MIRLENVLKMSWKHLCYTSWRCLQDFLPRRLEGILKMSWKQDVLKMYSKDEYIRLDQDVFWKRMTTANIPVLIRISWRHLKNVFWRRRRKTSSRRLCYRVQEMYDKAVDTCLFVSDSVPDWYNRNVWQSCFQIIFYT